MCVQEVVNVYCKQIFFIGRRLLGHTVCYLNIIMFRVQFTCNGCKPYHLIPSTIRTMVLISGGQKAKRFFCSFFRRGGGGWLGVELNGCILYARQKDFIISIPYLYYIFIFIVPINAFPLVWNPLRESFKLSCLLRWRRIPVKPCLRFTTR